jgi:3-phosphoshikimate 1-carboxyvinyltransferase
MRITAPPSKAHTLRALFIGALSEGKTTLLNPLIAEDQLIAIHALKALGAQFILSPEKIEIIGTGGKKKSDPIQLFIGNSGVSCRFLTVIAPILAKGEVTIDGDSAMRKRPLTQLLEAIKPLGIHSSSETGYPPVALHCEAFLGGQTTVEGNISSQYLSALLIGAPYAEHDIVIDLKGPLKSKPYVYLTIAMMRQFGTEATVDNGQFRVKAGRSYQGQTIEIEGDYSNSSYFLAAAAVAQKTISVDRLEPDSLQGDKAILPILERFGNTVIRSGSTVTVIGKSLQPIEIDMAQTPDLVPTVAVTAAFAPGITRIHGVGHLRFKETDRLQALVNELKKMNISCTIERETLQINGGAPSPATINTYNDHRIAMAFTIAKLRLPELTLSNRECVKKSFPQFFTIWDSLF